MSTNSRVVATTPAVGFNAVWWYSSPVVKPIHIVLTTRQFAPCIGGTETYTRESLRRLVARGYKVTVITMNRNLWTGERLAREEWIDGIRVLRIAFLKFPLRPLGLCNPWWLWRQLREADVVQNGDMRFLFEACLLAKIFLRKPLVFTSHGYILHQQKLLWLKKLVFRYYYKPLFRWGDALQVVSYQDRDKVADVLPPEKIVLVLGGVDVAKFTGEIRQPEAGRLLYFGRIDSHKGVDLLLEALARVRAPFRLRVVFGSSHAETLAAWKAQAERLGLGGRVDWVGAIDHGALRQEMARAQAVVFPSRYEGFGLTTLEAMAAGAVVVCNRIEAFENIVREGQNGFLVDFLSPERAAAALEKVLALAPEQSESLARAAAQEAARHDWSARIPTLEKMYRHLVSPSLRGEAEAIS